MSDLRFKKMEKMNAEDITDHCVISIYMGDNGGISVGIEQNFGDFIRKKEWKHELADTIVKALRDTLNRHFADS